MLAVALWCASCVCVLAIAIAGTRALKYHGAKQISGGNGPTQWLRNIRAVALMRADIKVCVSRRVRACARVCVRVRLLVRICTLIRNSGKVSNAAHSRNTKSRLPHTSARTHTLDGHVRLVGWLGAHSRTQINQTSRTVRARKSLARMNRVIIHCAHHQSSTVCTPQRVVLIACLPVCRRHSSGRAGQCETM